MNRDDIIRMAREAGSCAGVCAGCDRVEVFCGNELERFAALVAAAEREECARLCEQFDAENPHIGQGKACAYEIRARGYHSADQKIKQHFGVE